MSKRKHDEAQPTSSPSTTGDIDLFESTPIHDRSSKFIAVFTPSTDSPRSLQRHKPFESAMHKILAWRKPSTQKSLVSSFSANSAAGNPAKATSLQNNQPLKTVLETGSDEDGEKWAGKKLEKVLIDLNVQGTVVVARWYGGVMLGPIRFKWIEDAAREAIMKWRASTGSGSQNDSSADVKRVKVDNTIDEDDPQVKERLLRVLRERDASVNVLRSLLAEKNAELKRKQARVDGDEDKGRDMQEETVKNPSVTVPDYSSMPISRMRQMEKARDATLNWILKQIDLVEEAIKKG